MCTMTRHRRRCQKFMLWEVQDHAHKGVSKWITCMIGQNLEVIIFVLILLVLVSKGVCFLTPCCNCVLSRFIKRNIKFSKKNEINHAQNDARQNNSQEADSVDWSHVWWIDVEGNVRKSCHENSNIVPTRVSQNGSLAWLFKIWRFARFAHVFLASGSEG